MEKTIHIFVISFVIACVIGWGLNIYKLVTVCDFTSPYKCEVVHTVGVFAVPVGVITGYVNFEDN